MNVVYILLALAVVLALLATWVKSRRAASGPYLLLESLLDSDELRLAQLLEQAAEGRYRLLSKVPLDSMLAVNLTPRSKGWKRANQALQGLSADFLLCDRQFGPLLLVALAPAERPLITICQQIGLPLLTVDVRRSYNVDELRQQLQRALTYHAPDLELESDLPPLRATDTPRDEATPKLMPQRETFAAPQRETTIAPQREAAIRASATNSTPHRHPPAVADRQEPVFDLGRSAQPPRIHSNPTATQRPLAPRTAAQRTPPAASSQDGQAPHCPRCRATMVRVRPKDGRAAPFWSCSSYPQCRTTLADSGEPTVSSRAADPHGGLPPLRAER